MGLVKSIKWSYIGNILSKTLGFVFQILIIRLLSPEDSASYFILLTLAYLIMLPTLYPLSGIASRYFPFLEKNLKKQKGLILYYFISSFAILFALLITSYYLLGATIIKFYPILNGKLIDVPLTILAIGLFVTINNVLTGKKLFKELALTNIVNSTTKVVMLLGFYFFSILSFKETMITFYFSTFLSTLFGTYFVIKNFYVGKPLFPNLKEIWDMVKYSIGTTIEFARGFIANWIDTAFLGVFTIPKDVSGYNGTFSLLRNAQMVLINPIFSTSFPYMVSALDNKENFNRLTNTISKAGIYFSVIFSVLVFFLSEEIVLLLIPQYSEYSYLLKLLAIYIIFSNLASWFANIIKAIRWVKPIIYSSIGVIIINISLNLLLIPKYGVLGAAIGTITAYVFELIYFIYIIRKINEMGYRLKIPLAKPLSLGVLLSLFLVGVNFEGFLVSALIKVIIVGVVSTLFLLKLEGKEVEFLKNKVIREIIGG